MPARAHGGTDLAHSSAGNARSLFRRALLTWYDKNRRNLPWRNTKDPYRIWVSEIMLQQTRVAAVLEHYRRFLERFPSLEVLAACSENDVLAAWSGLGYYRRARMMRNCAQQVVRDHASVFPDNSSALQTLPGIGRYTAAAIASIAFNEPVAVVDGNVERVLDRLIGRELSDKENWHYAQSLLSRQRPADFNQAMMELGATVCTPRQPRCEGCPARKWCVTQGEASGRTASAEPGIQAAAQEISRGHSRQTRKTISCVLDQRDRHIRLVRRPTSESLMPGMWELPRAGGRRSSSPVEANTEPRDRGESAAVSQRTGRLSSTAVKNERAEEPVLWRTFRHSITVTNYTVHVLRDTASRGRRVAIGEIPQLPITGLTRKILKAASIL